MMVRRQICIEALVRTGYLKYGMKSRFSLQSEKSVRSYKTPLQSFETSMVKIPNRFEDLYPATAIERVFQALQQPELSGKVKETLDRVGLGDVNPLEQVQQAWRQAKDWVQTFVGDDPPPGTTNVINASGQLLNSKVSHLPISRVVAQALVSQSIRFQQPSESAFEGAIARKLGADSIGMFTHCSLALQAMCKSRSIVVSKADLVRIPGLGDVRSLLGSAQVVEAGPSNGCQRSDWDAACREEIASGADPQTALCILIVSPSMLGASEFQQQADDALAVAQDLQIPVFMLCADSVVDQGLATQFGFPLISQWLHAGVSALVAPTDLLLGGPKGGIVVGATDVVNQAVRIGSDLGALSKPAEQNAFFLALDSATGTSDGDANAIASLLKVNQENLRERARRIAAQLTDNGVVKEAIETERVAPLGPSPWNRYQPNSWCVRIQGVDGKEDLLSRLGAGTTDDSGGFIPPIVCHENEQALDLDLRFVDPKDDHLLVLSLTPPESPIFDASQDSASGPSGDSDGSSPD